MTQWIFIQLFKKGLAYKKETTVNYCTGCKVVLANEEVVNGVCERCGSPVVQKNKSQWMLKITAYANRLIDDLDDVDYIDRVKAQQRNWIGRSHGAEINFDTTAGDTPDRLHHPRRYALRLHLHGHQPRACLHQKVNRRRPHQECRRCLRLSGGSCPQV